MRQILVDYAKAQQRQKRGGGATKVELDEAALIFVRLLQKDPGDTRARDRLDEALGGFFFAPLTSD